MRRALLGILVLASASMLPSARALTDNSETGFDANVVVFSDRPDRVAAVIDPDLDGDYEQVIWATGRSAHGLPSEVVASLPLTLNNALVNMGGESAVRIQGRDEGEVAWEILFGAEKGQPENFGIEGRHDGWVLHLEHGAGVTTMQLPIELTNGAQGELEIEYARELTGDFATVQRGQSARWDAPASPLDDDDCESGGPGATSCSQGCSFGWGVNGKLTLIGGGTNGTIMASCNVSCSDGYHACCNCQFSLNRFFGWLVPELESSCLCVED